MMMMKRKLLPAAALLAMLSTIEANAQTANLDVSAEVPEACVITSGATLTMDFGIVDPVNGSGGGADYVLQSTLEYECSVGTTGWVDLGLGNGPGASLAERFMQGTGPGPNLLGYRLEQTDTSDFGTGDPGAGGDGVAFAGTGFGSTIQTVIQGRLSVAQMQAAQADTYSDTVTITLVL